MRQITRLVLENFQSHAHSELHFSPGLNVIIGPSDQGKSAIIRALRWALYNAPRGSDFVRVGATTCRVTVVFSDGTEIVRERLNARNRYVLRLPGEAAEQVFEGFGTDVPLEIVRAHGMPEVALDRDRAVTLNLGGQLEGPFLLSDSGADRARAIGRLTGVHVIDAALRLLQRDTLQQRKRERELASEIERLDTQLAQFADLPAQEAAAQTAATALARAQLLSARLERLGAQRQALLRVEAELARVGAGLQRLNGLPTAQAAQARAALLAQRLQSLTALHSRLVETQHRQQEGQRLIGEVQREFTTQVHLYTAALRRLGKCPVCLGPVGPDVIEHISHELLGEGERSAG